MNAGADINRQDQFGNCPLRCAAEAGHTRIVAFLLSLGADPELRAVDGLSVIEATRRIAEVRWKNKLGRVCRSMEQSIVSGGRTGGKAIPSVQQSNSTSPFGIADFIELMKTGHPEWSLFAVLAPISSVTRTFVKLKHAPTWHRGVLQKPAVTPEAVAPFTVIASVTQSRWTIVLRSIFITTSNELHNVPNEAKTLSRILNTKTVTFIAEDTSNAVGCTVYDRGQIIENAEWEDGASFISFSSKLRYQPDIDVVDMRFADEMFKDRGVYLSACYPRAEENAVWLSISKRSAGRIAKADFISFEAK